MVITVKKRLVAIISATVMLFVLLIVGMAASPAAAEITCPPKQIAIIIKGLSVCVPLSVLPTITITLPRLTDTVTLPRVTKNNIVKIPGKTTTLPRSTVIKTRRVTVPGPETTKFTTVNRVTTVTKGGQTVTKRATITQPAETVTSTTTEIHDDQIVVTKFKAASLSIVIFIIGALIGLLLLWAAYTYGWLQGDGGNRKFLREFRDDLKYKD
jgi:hypothetical protein